MVSNAINFIFPIRLGEIMKLYIINRIGGITYPCSISAGLIDRFSQLLLTFVFLLFTPIAGFLIFFRYSTPLFFFIILATLFVFVFAFVFGKQSMNVIEKIIRYFLSLIGVARYSIENFSKNRFMIFLKDVLKKMDLKSFTRSNIVIIIFFSFIITSLDGTCYYLFMKAFGISITWIQATLGACFMLIMFILPTPPIQIGTAEMYPVIIFSFGLGFPSDAVSSVAVLWHLLTSGIFIVLGIISLISLGIRLRVLLKYFREKRT